MRNNRDIYKLRRQTFFLQAISFLVLLFGVISVILFINPLLVGVPPAQQNSYRGDWVWLGVGIFFIVFACFFSFVSGRWHRRLLWILNEVEPEQMQLSIEIESDSESTNYYALLSSIQENTESRQLWKAALINPSWDVRCLTEKQIAAKVYLDPKSHKPAVIETEFGLLWRMAGNGAATAYHLGAIRQATVIKSAGNNHQD